MPYDLRDHYLKGLNKRETRTDPEICQGDPNDMAYGKLISLVEKHEVTEIVRMMDGNPNLTKPMTTQGLGRRVQIAAKYFAGEKKQTLSEWRDAINVIRKTNGLSDLAPSWVWENGKVPPGVRGLVGRKVGSLSAEHALTPRTTATPALNRRKTGTGRVLPLSGNPSATGASTANSSAGDIDESLKDGESDDEDNEDPFADLEAAVAREDIPTTEHDQDEPTEREFSATSAREALYMETLAPQRNYAFTPSSSPRSPRTPELSRRLFMAALTPPSTLADTPQPEGQVQGVKEEDIDTD